MMSGFRIIFALLALSLTMMGCAEQGTPAKSVPPSARANNPNLEPLAQPQSAAPVQNSHLHVLVTTPGTPRRFFRSVPENRQVQERTMELSSFKKTIENTRIRLHVALLEPVNSKAVVKLYGQGKLVDTGVIKALDSKVDDEKRAVPAAASAKLELKFTTPKLSEEERSQGFATVPYDLVVFNGGEISHQSFTLAVYDESRPSFVVPRPEACVFHQEPVRASGCFQNRTRSTQSISIGDSYQTSHDVNVQYSGQITIPISIVQFQLGAQRSSTTSKQTANGTQIQYTMCIECSAILYRQVVEDRRTVDIYYMRVDGTETWSGQAEVNNKQVAYEFVSTPSESQDYSCNIPSQMPRGLSCTGSR